ncbi:MAG TPA: metallophosphoesterase [Candidatus Dormibacteraeota bacterium]|nr:metallophosphoesterase [Candidatus Dormibacteraeota bacterium]
MAFTRIFFTSDVHGSEVCFMKFVNAAKVYKANAIILGGDITGKMIVPIVERPDGTFAATFLGTTQIMKTPAERDALEKNIRNSGYYPYRTTPAEVEELQADQSTVHDLFSRIMVDGVKRWVAIAEERLKGSNTKCYISPGNDDRFDIDEVLKSSSVVQCPEDEVVWVDANHEMITSGWSNVTPWNSPRETTEDKLAEKFNHMASKVERMENCIFNLHCPPFDTPLDLAPELDKTLKPVVRSGGEVSMVHVGSTAVRQLIEQHKPFLGLHGHIHEARGFVKIGRTLCINPGSEYGEGILRGSLLNMDEKALKSHLLTQG